MRRVDVLNSEIVSLIQLRLSSEFDPYSVPYTFGLVSHLSYAYKIFAFFLQ